MNEQQAPRNIALSGAGAPDETRRALRAGSLPVELVGGA